jgi:hypothetical protein
MTMSIERRLSSGKHLSNDTGLKILGSRFRQFPSEGLCGLLPRAVKADQTAERTGQTDDAIVKVDEAESA